jgi:hypothetical protein
MWKDGRRSNDYKYFDRRISEMFTIGGTGINLHKYLGTVDQSIGTTVTASQTVVGDVVAVNDTSKLKPGQFVYGPNIAKGTTIVTKTTTTIKLSLPTTAPVTANTVIKFSNDATQPGYSTVSSQNIQDLLFLENRDRKYDTDVYTLRGIYNVSDSDFDLSQFGLFLNTGTLFMVFHINDMVDIVGRRIMNGDVLELQHLKDYQALDESLPAALKRYYVVSDTSRASEGFSPSWWAHLWRVKLQPLVDSQEYKDLLNNIKAGDDTDDSLADILSTYQKYIDINDNIILQAEKDVPYSGYDTGPLYTKALRSDGYPEDPFNTTVDDTDINVASGRVTADDGIQSPDKSIQGYLTGDGLAPNGLFVASGISFPTDPLLGAYFLRLDFKPNRLFRYNGNKWVKIEDRVRTRLTPGPENKTQRSSFVNNTNNYTNANNEVIDERQALNEIFKPRAD